jgi:type II secretory pathway pseudopilin PulG
MKHINIPHRPGSTLIELLIYLAIVGGVLAAILPLLFSATETRVLQKTISTVEQNGTQILQNITAQVRGAERILSPAIGQAGQVLVLQTESESTNPTIIGLSSGSIILIEHSTRELISSEQVGVADLVVRNTSTSATQQSVSISFRISRTIRLQQPHSYGQRFETLVNLLPNDRPVGDRCGCLLLGCQGNNTYAWQVCDDWSCLEATTHMQCP